MTTFTYEISHTQRKDKTYQVYIRMTHKRKLVHNPANMYLTKEQLSRDLKKIRDTRMLDIIASKIEELRSLAAEVAGSEYMTTQELWNAIEAKRQDKFGFRLDIFQYAETKMASMEYKTAEGYKNSLNALKRYLGRDKLDINEVTHTLLVGFRDWLEQNNGKGCRAASKYLSCLRHIHNLARGEYNDDDLGIVRIPRQPFKKGLIPPQPVTEHRTLSVEQMRAIIDYQPTNVRTASAKDAFLLSFFLIGMNTADLYQLKKGSLKGGVITYNRAKTDSVRADNATMQVRVEDEAREMMERRHGLKNLLNFAEQYYDHRSFNNNVNIGLKEIGEAIGVNGLTSYYARHTWATMARNQCSIPFETVQEALNHAKRGSDRITDIYVERDFHSVWEANRKVIDYVIGK